MVIRTEGKARCLNAQTGPRPALARTRSLKGKTAFQGRMFPAVVSAGVVHTEPATVYVDSFAGNITCFIAAQKCHDVGNFLGRAHTF